MAVEHMVWFRFKPGVDDARIDHHAQGLAALASKIEGVTSIRVGRNFTDRAQGHQLGLLVTLTDRAALDHYAAHPDHVAVAGPLKDDCDSVMAMDIEA